MVRDSRSRWPSGGTPQLPTRAARAVTLRGVDLKRSLNGAIAGGLAATVWAAQQPADKRAFDSGYDDVELLGKLVTRGDAWPVAGLALHVANGALFGAVYAQLRPFLPGPPRSGAVTMAMAEHLALWPLGRLVGPLPPGAQGAARRSGATRRAFAQATWRHALFGVVLGELERRLNADREEEPPPVPCPRTDTGTSSGRGAAA